MIKSGSDKKNLVILTLYFPPTISIASNRLLAFARYLDKQKFNITVICPESDGENNEIDDLESIRVIRLKNKQHLLKISFSKKDTFIIHKLKALHNKIFNYFVKNEFKSWGKSAIEVLEDIYEREKIDYVISTFPMVAPHLVALQLKESGYNFKWIADMRDEMSKNPNINYLQKRYLAKVEQSIFSTASLISTVTPRFVNSFQKLSKKISIHVAEIRNGYSFDLPDNYNFNNEFTITHAGTFYTDIKPYNFLKAVKSLLSRNELALLKINFIGAGNAVSIPKKLQSIVNITPRLPHSVAETYIKNSDANLLIVPQSFSDTLPGKLYEYIASLKPVIAISGKNSEAEQLINACNAGFIADENKISEIEDAILKAYELWKSKKRLPVNIELIKQFHRKEQVRKLEKIILEL